MEYEIYLAHHISKLDLNKFFVDTRNMHIEYDIYD